MQYLYQHNHSSSCSFFAASSSLTCLKISSTSGIDPSSPSLTVIGSPSALSVSLAALSAFLVAEAFFALGFDAFDFLGLGGALSFLAGGP